MILRKCCLDKYIKKLKLFSLSFFSIYYLVLEEYNKKNKIKKELDNYIIKPITNYS